MMDVTFISTPDDGSCGIGTYTGELRRSLPEETNHDHVVVELGNTNPLHFLKAAFKGATTNAPVIHVQHEYGLFGPASIFSWFFFPILYTLAKLQQKTVVMTFHSAWSKKIIDDGTLQPLKYGYLVANNRLLRFFSDHLVFLSENTKRSYQTTTPLGDNDYTLIPHGVPTDTRDMTKEEAKRKFGYNSDDAVIVEPGYVRPEKGYDSFVDIACECPDYEFLIAGGSPQGRSNEYVSQLQERAPENVQITGILDDEEFHAAFIAADLIALPYEEVTQSGVFNWCVAYELPVVSSSAEYFRYLQQEHGCVALFTDEEASERANFITKTIQDDVLRNELSENMAAYRESRTMTEVGKTHLTLYN